MNLEFLSKVGLAIYGHSVSLTCWLRSLLFRDSAVVRLISLHALFFFFFSTSLTDG